MNFLIALIFFLFSFLYPLGTIPENLIKETEFNAIATSEKLQGEKLRNKLIEMLGIPHERCDLDPEFRGSFEHDGIIVEKWIWTSEPGSKVTSLLYRPKEARCLMPGMVITNGHGGSKNTANNVFTAQLYAKMGISTLLYDTLGEEERQIKGIKGTRDHDKPEADERAGNAGRLMMGKMVFDVMRGVDFLIEKQGINPEMIGIAGNSLGGAKATWMLALDPRLKAVIVSGWGFGSYNSEMGKRCTRIPAQLREQLTKWTEYLILAEKNTSILVMNGEKDEIIDQNGSGLIWRQTSENIVSTSQNFANYGNVIEAWYDPEGGHRSYHNHKDAFLWLNEHFHTPGWSKQSIEQIPEITFEQWLERNNLHFENSHYKLYWPDRHMRGGRYLDLNIKLLPEEKLKCLNPDEIGLPEYTLEGWLDLIEGKQNSEIDSSVIIQELKPWYSGGGPEINKGFTTEYMRSRSPRIVQKINNDWTFNYFPDETLDEQPSSVNYNDSSWPVVAIPHSWHNYETTKQLHPFILNASDKKASFFGDESGIGNRAFWWHGWGWYRKSFEIKNLIKDKRIFLEFEGVMKYCKVYLNGEYLGDHKGGFNSFYFDISDQINQVGKNVLAVAVRNHLDDKFRIPPMHSGNQTHSGGIYRNVRIVVKNSLYIPFQGSYKHEGGTFVTTPIVNKDSAVVKVKTWIKNDTKTQKRVSLITTIEDANQKELCLATLNKTIYPGEIEQFLQVVPPIINPIFWTPETPDLYKVRSFVYYEGVLTDCYESPLGIRTFEWDYNNNIGILNGKPVHFHGTNRTQAFPWLNNAIPEWIDVMDIRDIRFGQGHNFIRPNIHPNNLLIHDLFDQWGMLVNLGSPMIKDIDFSEEIQEQMIREAIRQHRNRPSIIFYSVGNETNDGADSKWIYEEDSTRIIHARKVKGGKGDYVAHDHTNMDMENLLRCTVRGWTHDDIYPENPVHGQHTGNEVWQHNQSIIEDGSIRGRIDMHNGVMWMYCDDGADRVYKNAPLKNINPKGWVDLYRVPKYIYFLWQANYLSNPMAFIHPHFWQRKYIGTKQDIVIDSNCDEVTLFVNQKKIGKKYPDKNNFFIVKFDNILIESGELKVIGKKQNELAEFILQMAGKPEKLRLKVSHDTIEAARNNVVTVTVDATDKEGVQVQDFNNSLQWEVRGPATLVGPAYWETDIHKNNADSGCWYMTAPVVNVVRSDGTPGVITIIVSSPGLHSDTIKLYAIPKIIERNSLINEVELENEGRIPVEWKNGFIRADRKTLKKMDQVKIDFNFDSEENYRFYVNHFSDFIKKNNSDLSVYPNLLEAIAEHFAQHVIDNNGVLVADDYNFIVERINNFMYLVDTGKVDTKKLKDRKYLREFVSKGIF